MPSRVDPNSRLVITGTTFNWIVDSINRLQRSSASSVMREQREGVPWFYIKNETPTLIPRFGILKPEAPLLGTANESAFLNSQDWSGTIPDADTETFVVAIRPIAPYQTGRAIIAGATTVRLQVLNTRHQFARAISGDQGKLESCLEPTNTEILWKGPLTGDECWAKVRLGRRPAQSYYRATAAMPIAAGASGDVLLYMDPGVGSGILVEGVLHDWMTGDVGIENGMELFVAYFASEKVWRIVGAECPTE